MICQQTRRPGRQGVYLFCIPPYLRPVSPPRSSVHPTPNTQPPQLALRDPKRGCRWTRAHSTACQAICPGLVGDCCDGMQHLSQRAAPLVTSCIQRMDAQYSVLRTRSQPWLLVPGMYRSFPPSPRHSAGVSRCLEGWSAASTPHAAAEPGSYRFSEDQTKGERAWSCSSAARLDLES